MNVVNSLVKLVSCFTPVLLTPLAGYLIADGYLNFGGGEKDLLLLVPWAAWALIYLLIFMIAWRRRMNMPLILLYSIGGATGVLAVVWVALFIGFNQFLGFHKG